MILKDFVADTEKTDCNGKMIKADLLSENFKKHGLKEIFFKDPAERRSGVEKRQLFFAVHIPEKRSGEDRRSGVDRRSSPIHYLGGKELRRIFQ